MMQPKFNLLGICMFTYVKHMLKCWSSECFFLGGRNAYDAGKHAPSLHVWCPPSIGDWEQTGGVGASFLFWSVRVAVSIRALSPFSCRLWLLAVFLVARLKHCKSSSALISDKLLWLSVTNNQPIAIRGFSAIVSPNRYKLSKTECSSEYLVVRLIPVE